MGWVISSYPAQILLGGHRGAKGPRRSGWEWIIGALMGTEVLTGLPSFPVSLAIDCVLHNAPDFAQDDGRLCDPTSKGCAV